jgi:hypothetical protein
METMLGFLSLGKDAPMCSAAAQGVSQIYLFALFCSTLIIVAVGIHVWRGIGRGHHMRASLKTDLDEVKSESEKCLEGGSTQELPGCCLLWQLFLKF